MINLQLKLLMIGATMSIMTSTPCRSEAIPPEGELPFKAIHFVVKDAKTGNPISVGTETIKLDKGVLSKNTVYWLPGDKTKVIQEETCSFDLKTLRPKIYKFQNQITGESVAMVSTAGNSWSDKILYRESLQKPEETAVFSWQSDLVIGKTLHHVIVRSWPELLKGNAKSFPLFVPMKRDQFGFRVVNKKTDQSPRGKARIISLELENWALRQLAPTMLFHYEERSGVPLLVRYEGPTTVVVDNDANKNVVIEFQYES